MKTSSGIHTELGRNLGFTTALAIGVGTMIAAGIFTLSGLAIRNVGSAAIVSNSSFLSTDVFHKVLLSPPMTTLWLSGLATSTNVPVRPL